MYFTALKCVQQSVDTVDRDIAATSDDTDSPTAPSDSTTSINNFEAELSTISIEPLGKGKKSEATKIKEKKDKTSDTKGKKGLFPKVKTRIATPGIGGSKFVEDFGMKSKHNAEVPHFGTLS